MIRTARSFKRYRPGFLPVCVAVAAAMLAGSAIAARPLGPTGFLADCSAPSPVASVSNLDGKAGEFVVADASGSARSSQLRAAYRSVAQNVLDGAEKRSAVFVLETFTASSSSVKLQFGGSFDPATGDDLRDRAERNRVKCQGAKALQVAFRDGRPVSTGSDPAGALATTIDVARHFVREGKPVRITLLTDGWIAPAPTGVNHALFNLESEIKRGHSPKSIIKRYREQLVLTSAPGMDITIRGLDHRGNADQGNSVEAARLVSFYTALCKTLKAKSCDVTSGF